ALSVTKRADPLRVGVLGQPVTYSLTVTNTGNVTISGITVTDVVTTPDSDPAPVVTCPTTTLAPGGSTTCIAITTVTQADLDAGTIADTATATGTDPSGVAVPPADASFVVNASATPSLSVVKTATPEAVDTVGQLVRYRFLVTNNGNATLHDIVVDDV